METELDLRGRVGHFFEVAGLMGVMAVLMAVLVLILLAIMGKRKPLLLVYVFAMMLSGAAVESLDSGSTLLRWAMILLLGLTVIRDRSWPGVPAIMVGIFAIQTLVLAPLSPSILWSVEQGTLMFAVAVLMASALAVEMRDLRGIYSLLRVVLAAAAVYVILGFATIGSLRQGERFAGATTSAPLFVLTGGLLLPVAVWGTFAEGLGKWRWYSAFLATSIFILCVISGQRTGTYAGFVGCLPLLARFGFRKLGVALVVALLAGGALMIVMRAMPGQAEYVEQRFGSVDTTGRVERWTNALQLCIEKPFVGHGAGAMGTTGFGFHNAFLESWYEQGIVGLLLIGGAVIMMLVQSIRLMICCRDTQMKDLSRLLVGLVLTNMLAALGESKLISPSNVAIFFLVFSSAVIVSLQRIARAEGVYDFPDAAYPPAGHPWPGPYPG